MTPLRQKMIEAMQVRGFSARESTTEPIGCQAGESSV